MKINQSECQRPSKKVKPLSRLNGLTPCRSIFQEAEKGLREVFGVFGNDPVRALKSLEPRMGNLLGQIFRFEREGQEILLPIGDESRGLDLLKILPSVKLFENFHLPLLVSQRLRVRIFKNRL